LKQSWSGKILNGNRGPNGTGFNMGTVTLDIFILGPTIGRKLILSALLLTIVGEYGGRRRKSVEFSLNNIRIFSPRIGLVVWRLVWNLWRGVSRMR
jgi:hypothetical protein